METTETYTLKSLLCENCEFSGDLEIQKGFMLKEAKCPTCGNVNVLYKQIV